MLGSELVKFLVEHPHLLDCPVLLELPYQRDRASIQIQAGRNFFIVAPQGRLGRGAKEMLQRLETTAKKIEEAIKEVKKTTKKIKKCYLGGNDEEVE